MGFGRLAIILCLAGTFMANGQQPRPRVQVQAATAQRSLPSYFEELIRYEVALLTEAELTHAFGYEIPPNIAQRIEAIQDKDLKAHYREVYQRLILSSEKSMTPDRMVLTHFNQLKASSLFVLNLTRRQVTGEAVLIEMTKLNNAYLNVQSAIRFYLWALGDRPNTDLPKFQANMANYMNRVQNSIGFLRGVATLDVRQQYSGETYPDEGIGGIQDPQKAEPYPIFVPKEKRNEETGATEPNFEEGQVISPRRKSSK